MADHQLTILQIKSDLMDLWNEETTLQSYLEWFTILKPKLLEHFGIEKSDFLIYDNGSFVPIEGHRSLLKRSNAIPIDLLKSSQLQVNVQILNEKGYEYADDLLIIRKNEKHPLGLLIIKSTKKWHDFSQSPYLKELEKSVSHLIQAVRTMGFLVTREKKFRQLFKVTELFNSTMDSHVILDGIMQTIVESFPDFSSELLLSHEQKELTKSFKMFNYMTERPSAIDAFVSGEMTIENATDLSEKLINAPIKGRQGIYGVLQIKVPHDYVLISTQRNFIRMLANTAGSALENASLYEQSHLLNEDLQLVNETSRKLNSNMHFEEMILFLKEQLCKAFQPMEIAFILYDEELEYEVLPMSTEFFRSESGANCIDFISNHFMSGKAALFDANFSNNINEDLRFESVIAVPITNQDKIVGFVICMHESQYFFSFESFKLMQSLIGHSSLALTNSMLREQLQSLVDKDYLTKLYARRYLDKVIEKSLENDESGVLILLDIDDFKRINDSFGHEVGDQVLKQISAYMIKKINGEGIAARWGGEELALYFPNATHSEGSNFAEQLIVEIPIITNPSVTMSCGVNSWSSSNPTTFNDLFYLTDKALYKAKENGKNQVIYLNAKI